MFTTSWKTIFATIACRQSSQELANGRCIIWFRETLRLVVDPGGRTNFFNSTGVLSERRAALQHAAEYAFFERGEASAAAGSWSRQVYDFVQCYAAPLN